MLLNNLIFSIIYCSFSNTVFKEELSKLKELETELGIRIHALNKPNDQSIELNNVYLWAKRIHKIKPDNAIDPQLRKKIAVVFQQLSKDELIDRLITEQINSKRLPENSDKS